MIPDFIINPDPSIYLADNYVVLDLETTNYEKGSAIYADNHIVVGVTLTPVDGKIIWENSGDLKEYLLACIDRSYVFVAQNAKFELQWLQRMGIPLQHILPFDTQIAEYVLNGNIKVPLDLGSIAKRRGYGTKEPFIDICMRGGVCPSDMPRSLLYDRCDKDVVQTEAIFLQQRQELHEKDQLKTLYTRCIFTPVLADMEFNGLYLDGDRVEETYRDYARRLEECQQTLDRLTGGINLRSTIQRAEYLYDTLGFSEPTDRRGNPLRTARGNRRTDSDTISSFVPSSPEQSEFFRTYKEYNSLNAALSKNLDFFYGVKEEKDCLFFGRFNQTITATNRLSSSGRPIKFDLFKKPKSVQFQNLPRQFKKLFKARHKNWKIAEIDGAQLEFRVAAHLGRDKTATDNIRGGFDVHKYSSTVLTEHGETTSRQDAKAHTFKPLYGGRSGTKAQKAYYQAFREMYPGITSTQEEWIQHVVAHKELTIPSGLTFYWPDVRVEGSYVTFTPSICNYPVQSYATADIIPIAVTMLWHQIKDKELQSFLINTIHDSAIAELHPDEEDIFRDVAFYAFTEYVYFYLNKVYDDKFTVPLGAELKVGEHWSEGQETKYAMEPLWE